MPAAMFCIGGSDWRRAHIPRITQRIDVPILRYVTPTFTEDDVLPERAARVLTLRFILRSEDDEGTAIYELDGAY